jgi:hypothetical protein
MGVGGQRHAPAALPTGKTRYLLYRRLGGLQDRSGQVWKISPPPGFDPRTVKPVASRYIEYTRLNFNGGVYSADVLGCTGVVEFPLIYS